MPPFATLPPLARDLVFLRRGPQEMPYSPALLALLIGVSIALDAAIAERVVQVGLPHMAFSLLLMLALTWLALRVGEKSERFVQTASALIAADLVLTLLEIPVFMGVSTITPETKELTQAQALSYFLVWLFLVWELAVVGHIMRHALEVSMRIGVLIAVVFFVVGYFAGFFLFERGAA